MAVTGQNPLFPIFKGKLEVMFECHIRHCRRREVLQALLAEAVWRHAMPLWTSESLSEWTAQLWFLSEDLEARLQIWLYANFLSYPILSYPIQLLNFNFDRLRSIHKVLQPHIMKSIIPIPIFLLIRMRKWTACYLKKSLFTDVIVQMKVGVILS